MVLTARKLAQKQPKLGTESGNGFKLHLGRRTALLLASIATAAAAIAGHPLSRPLQCLLHLEGCVPVEVELALQLLAIAVPQAQVAAHQAAPLRNIAALHRKQKAGINAQRTRAHVNYRRAG